eukprot:CAMPEP_0174262496 /NCGR_PEP_ID=MMETSP0439-20130205/13007_1 /TAXON_ID=0 /ORGANISM="Stereomyxa ramosa, Strain Chinc5" /LENGTH=571 /DNA_ID=CAMNT_0015347213 /DNA_START=246 /DNA_END=1961 /DNA_ORIENTATION=-
MEEESHNSRVYMNYLDSASGEHNADKLNSEENSDEGVPTEAEIEGRQVTRSTHVEKMRECMQTLGILHEDFRQQMQTLLSNSTLSDFTFIFPDTEIHAHKAILGCRSSYFKLLFSETPTIDVLEVHLADDVFIIGDMFDESFTFNSSVFSDLFRLLLSYIYTGQRPLTKNPNREKIFCWLVQKYFPEGGDKQKEGCESTRRPLLEDFASLVNNKELSDVTFEVKEKEGKTHTFYAHKAILSVRSPYFASFFSARWEGPTNEDQKQQHIKVVYELSSAKNFQGILNFIYCEKLHIPSINDCLELMYLADFYGLESMEWQCVRFCQESVKVENVCTLWNYSLEYDSESTGLIEEKCNYFAINNLIHILDRSSRGFKKLKEEAIKKVLHSEVVEKLCEWTPISMLIVSATKLWLEHYHKKTNDDADRKQLALSDIAPPWLVQQKNLLEIKHRKPLRRNSDEKKRILIKASSSELKRSPKYNVPYRYLPSRMKLPGDAELSMTMEETAVFIYELREIAMLTLCAVTRTEEGAKMFAFTEETSNLHCYFGYLLSRLENQMGLAWQQQRDYKRSSYS